MSELVTQPTLASVIKQTDSRLTELAETIGGTALALSGITKIKDVEHSNSLIEVIRKAKEPIKEIDELELEIRRQLTAKGKERQAIAENLYKPLKSEIERLESLRTNYVLEQQRKEQELKAKQEQDRKDRQQAIQVAQGIDTYFVNKAYLSRMGYIAQLGSFDSVEAIENFYKEFKPKPTITIAQKHIQTELDKYNPTVQKLALEQIDFALVSNKVNELAKGNDEYILGLKDSYITAINDAEERIRMQEQAKKDADALAEKQRLEAERAKADAILQAEISNQVEVQTLAPHNKGVRKKWALNKVAAVDKIPTTTFATLLSTFLNNGGDREKLLNLLVPVFNKTNKDKETISLEGFLWQEQINVVN